MAALAQVRREHVLAALRDLGPLEAPHDAPHRLARGGEEYDAVRVVQAALDLAADAAPQGAHPSAHPSAEPEDSPSPGDCALLLRGLGFELVGEALPPLRFTNAATVGAEHSHATWALAARERLLEVAATYGDAITYQELADFVQHRSLVRTSSHPRSWIGDVLRRVAEECARRREPFLTALVVDPRGTVGASYATALEAVRGLTPDDVDEQAAQERLECHRRFGAELPADGGGPVRLAAVAAPPRDPALGRTATTARRPRATKVATPRRAKAGGNRRTAEESVAAAATGTRTCPVHFTVIPPSGACDYCD